MDCPPLYFGTPSKGEHVIQSVLSDQASHTGNHNYTYTSTYPSRSGTRRSAFRLPVYGLAATIHSTITFAEKTAHAERIFLTLQGQVSISIVRAGGLSWVHQQTITCQTSTFEQKDFTSNVAGESALLFSVPFRSADLNRPLPPSFEASFANGSSGHVQYELLVCMTRSRNESFTIPILYLPKSRPDLEPLVEILAPVIADTVYTPLADGVKTSKLVPIFTGTAQKTRAILTPNTIYLSLPSSLCFVSGQSIPFIMTIWCITEPGMEKEVQPSLQVTLSRRTTLYGPNPVVHVHSDTVLSYAEILSASTGFAGTLTLKGQIKAGEPGKECSWALKGEAKVSYFVRAQMVSPTKTRTVWPNVYHEESCEVTTDPFGTHNAEIAATGGIPTPALGLLKSPLHC